MAALTVPGCLANRVALQMVVIYKLASTVEQVIDDDHHDHESVEDLKYNEDAQTDDKLMDYRFCLKIVAYDQKP